MTSWRRAETLLAAGALACGLALAGCGSSRRAETPPVPPSPSDPQEEADGPVPPAPRSSGAGLVPLPSRTQVVGAVPLGRRDPFGEVMPRPPAAASRPPAPAAVPSPPPPPPPPALPEGFRLAGVMRSGGRSAAVVQLGQRSESLRPGDLGGLSSELLPPGWRVAGIDVDRGSLTLLRGAQRLVVDL